MTHVNRKQPFLIFERRFCRNFQSNRLYKSKEAKQYKFLYHQGILRGKMPHFRLTSVDQKRFSSSSLLSEGGRLLSFPFNEV